MVPSKKWGSRTIVFCNTLSFRKIQKYRVRGPYVILNRNDTVILNRNDTVILNRNNTVILNEVKDLKRRYEALNQILR